ncbi:MAG: dephospho-CoA kinase [Hyphomicrobiales bacterium]|nr:dephospho-CoA kinase [Hyphomicrobiales bacterium]
MIVAGLTGSIAMGKSTVGAMFAALGAPVFDADAAVRGFYAGEGANAVEAMFPGVVVEGSVDRGRLAEIALLDPAALERLEALVHPAVAAARAQFVGRAAAGGRRVAIVDVPLLLETGGESAVDLVVVVSAPEDVQRARALARRGMHDAKLDAIMLRQMSDSEKRRRAHFVINTGGSLERTLVQARQFLRAVAAMERGGSGHA